MTRAELAELEACKAMLVENERELARVARESPAEQDVREQREFQARIRAERRVDTTPEALELQRRDPWRGTGW